MKNHANEVYNQHIIQRKMWYSKVKKDRQGPVQIIATTKHMKLTVAVMLVNQLSYLSLEERVRSGASSSYVPIVIFIIQYPNLKAKKPDIKGPSVKPTGKSMLVSARNRVRPP